MSESEDIYRTLADISRELGELNAHAKNLANRLQGVRDDVDAEDVALDLIHGERGAVEEQQLTVATANVDEEASSLRDNLERLSAQIEEERRLLLHHKVRLRPLIISGAQVRLMINLPPQEMEGPIENSYSKCFPPLFATMLQRY